MYRQQSPEHFSKWNEERCEAEHTTTTGLLKKDSILVNVDITRTKGPNTNIFYRIIIHHPFARNRPYKRTHAHCVSFSHSLFRLHTAFYRNAYWFYQRLIRLGRILGEIFSLSHSVPWLFAHSLALFSSVALSLSFSFENWYNHYRIVYTLTRFVCIML